MSDTILRPARGTDVDRIAEIWHEGWHDGHAGHVPDGLTAARTLPAFTERVRHRVTDTDETIVAEVDGEVAGFLMVELDEVEQLFVARGHRGSGLATTLLREGERQVAGKGYAVAWLAVVTGNARARRFYEREGWADAGDLPYVVEAGGEQFVSPCRRYETSVG